MHIYIDIEGAIVGQSSMWPGVFIDRAPSEARAQFAGVVLVAFADGGRVRGAHIERGDVALVDGALEVGALALAEPLTAEDLSTIVGSPVTIVEAAPTADHVRREAQRRMMLATGARDAGHLSIVIENGTREAVRLLRIRAERDWTPDEATRASQLEAFDGLIEAIRAASNAMEGDPPADYRDDARWPAMPGAPS